MTMLTDAAGFVLAGGRSSRMGTEKAFVPFAGEPLVTHALRTLREAGLSASIAGARSALKQFAPVVTDLEADRGPLGGICSALAWTELRWSLFLPVDLPLLPSSLVAFLLDSARALSSAVTVVAVNGYAQTFPVVLDRAALPWLSAALASGRGGCFAAFQAAAAGLQQSIQVVDVEEALRTGKLAMPKAPATDCWFLNVNAPEDLRRAEACRADEMRRE